MNRSRRPPVLRDILVVPAMPLIVVPGPGIALTVAGADVAGNPRRIAATREFLDGFYGFPLQAGNELTDRTR